MHLYSWLASKFLTPAEPVAADDSAHDAHDADAGETGASSEADAQLITSVIRWAGLASANLSEYRVQHAGVS